MERRDERIARAKKLARSDHPRAALDPYLELANTADRDGAGPLWTQIGELQLGLGDLGEAKQSFARAVDHFRSVEQFNNAIALCLLWIEADSTGRAAREQLATLALQQGYRLDATGAVSLLARTAAEEGRASDGIPWLLAVLRTFPDETSLWREWADELLGLGREDEALRLLGEIAETLAAEDLTAPAAAIRDEMARIDPSAHHSPETLGAPDADALAPTDLPLIGNVPELDVDAELSIPPLEGLEPTHAEAAEPLPLLDSSTPFGDPPETVSSEAPEEPALTGIVTGIRALTERRVDPSDGATHYDLGLAFKEMGLIEDAIAQLASAIEQGHDPIAVLEVLGEILVERGDLAAASRILRMAPGVLDSPAPERVGLHYWLARSEEGKDSGAEARRFLEWVVREDPTFRDAARRLEGPGVGGF